VGEKTGLLHADWGAPHCSGSLTTVVHGDEAEVVCDACGRLSWTLPAAGLQQTIQRMLNTRLTTLPHSEFGDPECCGCLDGHVRGDESDIICNECGVLIGTVPTKNLEKALNDMELTLDFCTQICRHCGKASVISGFTMMLAYTCQECGELVRLSGDPSVDRIFGPEDAE
jgi:hypothetical protein